MLYEVFDVNRKNIGQYEASSGEQAKRMACKRWGRIPSDAWTGIRSMSARKVKK